MRIRQLISVAAVSVAALATAAPAMAAPVNDDFDDAINLGSAATGSGSFTTSGATQDLFEPDYFAEGAHKTVWFKWTAPESGGVRVHICGSTHGLVRVYSGSHPQALADAPWSLALDDNTCDDEDQFAATKGVTYRIVVDHHKDHGATSGTIDLSQRAQKPVVQFPGWPATTPKTFTAKLTTSTWNGAQDAQLAAFGCKLDGKTTPCDENGVQGLTNLAHGQHTLVAVARDSHGNLQDGESVKTWNVDAQGPTVQMAWTGTKTFEAPPSITWTASETGVKYLCTVDYGDPFPCKSGWQAPALPAGPHVLQVHGIDAVGNHQQNAAFVTWEVVPPAPSLAASSDQTPAPTPAPAQAPAPSTEPAPTVQPAVVVGPQQPPASGVAATCNATVKAGRYKHRRMRVRLVGARDRSCTVTVRLKVRGKQVAKLVRVVPAGRTVAAVLKAKRRAPRRGLVKLAVSTR